MLAAHVAQNHGLDHRGLNDGVSVLPLGGILHQVIDALLDLGPFLAGIGSVAHGLQLAQHRFGPGIKVAGLLAHGH